MRRVPEQEPSAAAGGPGPPAGGGDATGDAGTVRLREHVAVPAPETAGLLVVPVEAACASLSRAVHLRGSAARAFEGLRAGGGLAELSRALLADGAGSAERAAADARRFLAELAGHGLLGGPPAPQPPASSPGPQAGNGAAAAQLGAEDLDRLARAVLARGLRLRFRASGRSMRPWIPHGSELDVRPAPFAAVGVGQVVLYSSGPRHLVAHRVLRRGARELFTRGDSSARLERVEEGAYLGVVEAAAPPGGPWRRVSAGWRRPAGLVGGLVWRAGALTLWWLALAPLSRTYGRPSRRRAWLRGLLRVLSGALTRGARACERLRAPVDVARAALLSAREKDEDRRRLYARRSVQDFTSLDENVAAGLTLLEELIFARHHLPPGRALVLGCGPGRECLALAERGFQVTGLDREEGLLSRARDEARRRGVELRLVSGEATEFHLAERFDYVVLFSGLLDMVLPRARRLAVLERAREHLAPGGRVLVTFLSAYLPPDGPPPAPGRGLWEAVNPEHEAGDLYLLNEAVHVYSRGADLAAEARAAGLAVEALFRDQRAYDRAVGRVRGYALLKSP